MQTITRPAQTAIPAISHRTKIVATLGPASRSVETLRQMVQAGMNVARLNFSHGSYEDHAKTIKMLRDVSEEFDTPVTILQDLQGPKIRVAQLPGETLVLTEHELVTLMPDDGILSEPNCFAIDYPDLAEEATPGTQILLDDGLLELQVEAIAGANLRCRVIKGGILKPRKGVNLPSLNLRLPSLTDKDKEDLEFGISQGVDWVCLSFVRRAEDILSLQALLTSKGTDLPVIAKIEKPQAIENLEAILEVTDGIMVARGDMGVEISPAKVPLLQKHIIRRCNQKGIPVITATQMLESMIQNPRPTRAEANDVANAILDGTDAVMLSGESAVGNYPVQAVAMMALIANEVEKQATFNQYAADRDDDTHAISEGLNVIDRLLPLRCIVAFTTSGYTARLVAEERPRAPVVALTPNIDVYHRLNLIWGVKPLLLDYEESSFEKIVSQAEEYLCDRKLVDRGDRILITGGIPVGQVGGTNFLKLHQVGG
uniref:Pyruvate kinase n=1 Tax=Oscillatoriales cyanobacterium SpSt-418 TaxID=2282169 RepID=A0A7C3KC98_9CYAN